jgi:hypothetical protein
MQLFGKASWQRSHYARSGTGVAIFDGVRDDDDDDVVDLL